MARCKAYLKMPDNVVGCNWQLEMPMHATACIDAFSGFAPMSAGLPGTPIAGLAALATVHHPRSRTSLARQEKLP
jgi:hypothetical protein